MGKCSLTAAIPVISVMGVQACPLPTAILSAQTGFPSYYCDDYTDRMDILMDEWQKMDFHPDGIYTGFLADAAQADKAWILYRDLRKKKQKSSLTRSWVMMGRNTRSIQKNCAKRMRMLVRRGSSDHSEHHGSVASSLWKRKNAHRMAEDFRFLRRGISEICPDDRQPAYREI